MRRHYEHLAAGTKAHEECRQFASLKSQVAKKLAKQYVDEKELDEAKAAAKGYADQLATAAAQLDAFKKDSGDLVNKLTQQLNNLYAEVARNDKKLNEAITV